MSHQVGIDPFDNSRVHINYLKEVMDRWITCGSTAVEDLSHVPVLGWRFTSQVVALNAHGHSWLDVEEQRSLSLLLVAAVLCGHRW